MTHWDIHIHTIATARTPGPEVLFQRGFGDWIDIAIHCFELRSTAGTILIDTGFAGPPDALNAAMQARKGMEAGFHLQAGDIWDRLEAAPLAVALTSFGPYAAGGVTGLPDGPTLYASARGMRNLQAPEEPYFDHPLPEEVQTVLQTRARAVNGSAELAPGVTFHEVGIHHPASAAIEVAAADGPIIIADPVFVARNLVDRVALGAAESAAEWYGMVRRLAAGGPRFLPIHDPHPLPVRLTLEQGGKWTANVERE